MDKLTVSFLDPDDYAQELTQKGIDISYFYFSRILALNNKGSLITIIQRRIFKRNTNQAFDSKQVLIQTKLTNRNTFTGLCSRPV